MTSSVTGWPRRVWAAVRLGRPLFLIGGVVMVALGASLALWHGAALNGETLLLVQLTVTCGQLMTHYGNEYHDLAADRANTRRGLWSGGSGVLPEGALPPETARRLAWGFGGGTLALLAVLALRGGWLAALLGLLAAGLAHAYSAPPLRLVASGAGEGVAALVVAGLTPLFAYAAQTGSVALRPALTLTPLVLLQLAMLLAVHFPDAAADARAGKRTLVVRLGGRGAGWLYQGALAAAYAVLIPLSAAGLPPVALLAMAIPAPLALWLSWRVAAGAHLRPGAQTALAFWSITLLIGTAALSALAFLLGAVV